MIYATFEYYKDDYSGIKIEDPKEFKRLALKASAFLDGVTFGRIDRTKPVEEPVQLGMCAIVDVMKDYESGDKGIVSERVGDLTTSYAGAELRTEESDAYAAAALFLSGTGLLYRGV
ncbi:MAG: hypothetical protein RSD63_08560 [Eubacterium sp.]